MTDKEALFTSARTGETDRDEWRTPLWVYNRLNTEFRFTLDPAATNENTLCLQWFTKKEDGLSQPWFGSVFLNPPYSQLKQWVRKAFLESAEGRCDAVLLVPARTDTKAWWDYLRFGDVRFLPGRLKFGDAKNSAPFPSAVVVFERGEQYRPPTTYYWDVHAPKESK